MEVKQGTKRRAFVKWLLAGGLVLLCLLLIFVKARIKRAAIREEEAQRKAELAAGPRVRVIRVTETPGEHTLTLVGETRPYQQALLYAKVSGYLKDVRVDKGDEVEKGQVLAVIESPETDQAYEAALADARNKIAIAARTVALFERHLVSPQERDQAQADAGVSAANLRTQEIFKSYKTLRAPFDGTITARFADPGALVQNATDSRTSALPVVTVSEINRLRVDVFVDQVDANYIQDGDPVVITWSGLEGRKIPGRVSRMADALDPRTRMLLTEIDIPNGNNALIAGSFVRVSLEVKSPSYRVAPVEALVLKRGKPYLTGVTPENRLTYRPIEIAHNDGKILWIVSGVHVGDQVALNVNDTIPEGGKVRPILEPGSEKSVHEG